MQSHMSTGVAEGELTSGDVMTGQRAEDCPDSGWQNKVPWTALQTTEVYSHSSDTWPKINMGGLLVKAFLVEAGYLLPRASQGGEQGGRENKRFRVFP